METATEEPQEVAIIQQWTTQKAQLFWFLDPMEFLIAVVALLFFPFFAWQCGMNLIATLFPGLGYMTLLILTILGGVPGEYREFAIHARLIDGTSFCKILLRLTDLEYPLYTSNPQTFARLRTLEDQLLRELQWNSPQRRKARENIIKELA